MAGSGKTTLLQRLSTHLHTCRTPGYVINLDPAVTQVPYGANIDIRDTVHMRLQKTKYSLSDTEPAGYKMLAFQVNYKNVMKQYGLGPNGGILTSLNLFATRFDQVCPPLCAHICTSDPRVVIPGGCIAGRILA